MKYLDAAAMLCVALACVGLPRTVGAQPQRSADRENCGTAAGSPRTFDTWLAGVPAIVRVPSRIARPPIVLWHGFGAPGTEQALMDVLPLDDVPAIKVYLGLPMFGHRQMPGGRADLAKRQQQDAGLQVFQPIVVGAEEELPGVLRALVDAGCMAPGERVGMFGFSAGGAAVLLSLIEQRNMISTAVLLNPSMGLDSSIQAYERATGRVYAWSPASRALAERTDAVRHAALIARGAPPPAILLLQGGDDAQIPGAAASAFSVAVEPLYARRGESARYRHVVIDGLAHNIESSDDARAWRGQVADWFNQHP